MKQADQIDIMRKALAEIALRSPMNGKPLLPRRDMQSVARRALIDAGLCCLGAAHHGESVAT